MAYVYSWRFGSSLPKLTIIKAPRGSWRRCGARRKRDGEPCRARALKNGRCRFHGGLSTGPRTTEGKARALANLRQYRTDQANLPNDFDKIRGP